MRRFFSLMLCLLLLLLSGCAPRYPKYPAPAGTSASYYEHDDESGLIHFTSTTNAKVVRDQGRLWRRFTDASGTWVIDDPALVITECGLRISLCKPAYTGPALPEPILFSLDPPTEAEGSWFMEFTEEECPYIRDYELSLTYVYTVTNTETGESWNDSFFAATSYSAS